MYIKTFRVRNFLSHKDTHIELLPLTVLVGPNGGGKSALFDALLNFSMLSRGNIKQAFGPYPYSFWATLFHAAVTPKRISFNVEMSRNPTDGEALRYEIDYAQVTSSEGEPAYAIFTERIVALPDNRVLFDRREPESFEVSRGLGLENDRSVFSALRARQLLEGVPPSNPLVAYCGQQISRFNKFRLDPSTLAQTSRLPDIQADIPPLHAPRIGYRGEDFASTLYYLSESKAPELDVICQKIREVDPKFECFDFNIVGTDRVAFSAVYSDTRERVPSVRLSSGTLVLMGLVTLVTTPSRPALLMIEEPENGLTPQAVKAFYQSVRSLVVGENPSTISQVILSSHSPFVICEAWNGEDRDFIYQIKTEEGHSCVRRFSEAVIDCGIQLAMDETGERTILGLRNAERIMSGYLQ